MSEIVFPYFWRARLPYGERAFKNCDDKILDWGHPRIYASQMRGPISADLSKTHFLSPADPEKNWARSVARCLLPGSLLGSCRLSREERFVCHQIHPAAPSNSHRNLTTAIICVLEAGGWPGLRVHRGCVCHFGSRCLKLMILHITVRMASDEEMEVCMEYKKIASHCCSISLFPFILSTNILAYSFPYILFDSFCHFHSLCNLLLSHSLVFNNEGCHGFPGIRHCPLDEYCYR